MLCLTALTLLPPAARAGSYSAASYSGGQVTNSAANPTQTGYSGSPYGGGAIVNNGSTVNCQGTVTASFTWSPAPGEPLPQSVVVVQTGNANWGGATQYGGPHQPQPAPTGSCDDGLKDPPQDTGNAGNTGQVSTGTYYQVVAGASPLVLPGVGAQAQISSGGGVTPGLGGPGSANVSYTAAAYPVTIDLTGTDTSTGANEALTGQQVTGTLNLHGVPLLAGTTPTYSWGQGNTNLFKSWSETAIPQMAAWAPSDYTGQKFAFYDAVGETVTLTCTVTFTTPDGAPHSLPITSASVAFLKPTGIFQANNWTPSPSAPQPGFEDDSPAKFGGRTWWHDVSISLPTGSPSGFSGGSACFSQIASLTRSNTGSYNGTTVTWQRLYINNSNGTQSLVTIATGADPGFQYPNAFETNSTRPISQWSVGDSVYGGDFPTQVENPTQNNGSSYTWAAAHASDSFTTYLMYKPPSNGATSVWVPLSSLTWGWNGDASTSTGSWLATGTGPKAGTSTATTTPPTWTATVPAPYTQL